MKPLFGTLDIGGTKVLAGVFDEDGRMLARRRLEVGASRVPDEVVGRMGDVLRALAADEGGSLASVGVSVPGPLTRATGVVHLSPNLGWRDYPLGPSLEQLLAVPVRIDDDANCAALGELHRGAGRGLSDFVLVIVGSGIGAGVVTGGRVMHGAHDLAGEIGHIAVVRCDGPPCGCGKRGCLEAVASGGAIGRRGGDLVAAGGGDAIREAAGGGAVTAETVFEAAERGDEAARRIVLEAADHLGQGLAVLANVLDPEALILGGGLGVRGGWYRDAVERSLRRYALEHSAAKLDLREADLGQEAGLFGAAVLAAQRAGDN